jgi:hypothetical protein
LGERAGHGRTGIDLDHSHDVEIESGNDSDHNHGVASENGSDHCDGVSGIDCDCCDGQGIGTGFLNDSDAVESGNEPFSGYEPYEFPRQYLLAPHEQLVPIMALIMIMCE